MSQGVHKPLLPPAPSNSVWGERVVKDQQKNGKMPAEPGFRNLQEQETGLLAPG